MPYSVLLLLLLTVLSLEIIQTICGDTSSGCAERSLVGDDRLQLPNSSYTASSYYFHTKYFDENGQDKRYLPHSAKLYSPYGWSPRTPNNSSDYLQVDLGTVRVITAVETQGDGAHGTYSPDWVTTFKLLFRYDRNSTTWIEYDNIFSNCDNKCSHTVCKECKYKGKQMTRETVVHHDLKTPQAARYIRFVPVDYHKYKTMRVNVFFINMQGPPNEVVVTPSQLSIYVQWALINWACRKLTTFILGYLLDVSTKGEFKVGPGITSKNITGLQPYTEYTIRVKAVPYGLWSDYKTIYTAVAVPQVIPTNFFKLEALSPKTIQVNWTKPPEHLVNGPLAGYKLSYAESSKEQRRNLDVGLVNTWTIESLKECTWYSITMSIKNSKYVGPPSKKASIRTMGNAPLVAPSNVSALPTNASFVAVSWHPVPEDKFTCNIIGYDVKLVQQVFTDVKKNDTTIVSETGISTVFTELSSCTYAVSVRAVTVIAPGPFSEPIYVSTAKPPLAAPSNVSAILTNATSIVVLWAPVPEYKLGCDVTLFDVKLMQHGCTDIKKNDTIIVSETGISTVFTELSPCTYAVSVRAVTIVGPGPFSEPIYISTTQRINIPQDNVNPSSENNLVTTFILGGLFGAIFLTFMAIFVAYFICKRPKGTRRKPNTRKGEKNEAIYMNAMDIRDWQSIDDQDVERYQPTSRKQLEDTYSSLDPSSKLFPKPSAAETSVIYENVHTFPCQQQNRGISQ